MFILEISPMTRALGAALFVFLIIVIAGLTLVLGKFFQKRSTTESFDVGKNAKKKKVKKAKKSKTAKSSTSKNESKKDFPSDPTLLATPEFNAFPDVANRQVPETRSPEVPSRPVSPFATKPTEGENW